MSPKLSLQSSQCHQHNAVKNTKFKKIPGIVVAEVQFYQFRHFQVLFGVFPFHFLDHSFLFPTLHF